MKCICHWSGNTALRKKTLFLPFILLFITLAACESDSPSDSGSSSFVWGEPSYGLRCSIAPLKTKLAQGDKAVVSVRVENVSGKPDTLTLLPVFVLADSFPRYAALSDITGKDANFGHNSRLVLALGKDDAIAADIDLNELFWALMISSISSDKHLYEAVKPGGYTLRLDLEVIGRGSGQWIRSNEVNIVIQP
jgi:hypothetical protein